MTKIDPNISQAVWARVGYGDCSSNNSLEQLLTEFATNAYHSQTLFQQVYITSHGALRAPMARLFHLSQIQFRSLSTLYFLTTGTTLPLAPTLPPEVDCLTKTLQEQYQTSVLSRENFKSAAVQFPALATFFSRLEARQGKIQQILVNLVAQRIG